METNTDVMENPVDTTEPWPRIAGGADIELANFVTGVDPAHAAMPAAKAILAEFEGFSNTTTVSTRTTSADSDTDFGEPAAATTTAFDPQDWGRRWSAANGSCAYIDMSHIELALPEVLSAKQFTAYQHAMLLLAMRARDAANRKLPSGMRIELIANNSDGRVSWGSHINHCMPRRAYERILHEKVHHMLYLAGFQASLMVLTGAGKVGADNGRPRVDYQLSQRADFIETMSGWQTTYRRPLINLRDEALCGAPRFSDTVVRPADKWARLHVIVFDSTLSPVCNFLRFGFMQIVLQMIARGWVDTGLLLEDPLHAVIAWSHDVSLSATVPLLTGGRTSAVDLQIRLLEHARRFVAEGLCQVVDAQEILDLWGDTLDKLKARDLPALARRLDWAHKLLLLNHAMRQYPNLTWQSPEIKSLDYQWAALNPNGLFWAMDRSGAVDHVVSETEIATAMIEPPDTRAFARAALLRMAGPQRLDSINWDTMTFKVQTNTGPATRKLDLPDPNLSGACFSRLIEGCNTLDETLDALSADPPVPVIEPFIWSTRGQRWLR